MTNNPYRPDNYQNYQSRTNRYQLSYKGRDTAQEGGTVEQLRFCKRRESQAHPPSFSHPHQIN